MASSKKICLELTIGHRASVRDKPTPELYTHDWEVFVRGEQGRIDSVVDRVTFQLHDSFPKPRRVVKDEPFKVHESGYAGFDIPIEILFKNKDKGHFQYNLFLQVDGPCTHSKKQRFYFNYPTNNEEFTKRLLEAGAFFHRETDSHRSGDSVATSSHLSPHSGGGGGGKSTKHSSTNPAKGSPKTHFENLFGTPIKRGSGSPSTTYMTSGSGKGPKTKPKGSGGGKGDKTPLKSPSSSAEKSKASSKSPAMPTLLSPSGSEISTKSTSSKSSRRSSSEKRSRVEDNDRKMLPPEHSSVPRKSKKDIFSPSPSSSTVESKGNKSKKKKSKHKYSKKEADSSPEQSSRKARRKSRLSPISSSSSDSSSSSSKSDSEPNTEPESEPESETEEMLEKSNKRIAAANSTSDSKRRPSQYQQKFSESESDRDESPAPRLSPATSLSPSSASSGISSPLPKRRKNSTSSSSRTPDHHRARSESPMEKPNSSSSVKAKKEGRHRRKSDDEKRNRKTHKKSKKHKKKVFEEEHSDSSVSSVESYASPMTNGVTSNGLSPNAGFAVASTSGTYTLEMGILQELYARITALAEANEGQRLQEIVDIVMDSGGQDLWSMETGLSFDFDLCKLSPSTIRKIQEAILD